MFELVLSTTKLINIIGDNIKPTAPVIEGGSCIAPNISSAIPTQTLGGSPRKYKKRDELPRYKEDTKEYQREYYKLRYNNDPEFKSRRRKYSLEYGRLHSRKQPKTKCSKCETDILLKNKSGLCSKHYALALASKLYHERLPDSRIKSRENGRRWRSSKQSW